MLMPLMRADIDACIRHHGRVDLQVMLAFGWSIDELLHAPHPETRRKAEAYAIRLEKLERSALGFACALMALAIIWLAAAIRVDITIPGL